MESSEPGRSSVGKYSPGVIGIFAITASSPLLFALIWLASQIGKIHTLPTLAVWITVITAFPLFVFGVTEIVIYFRTGDTWIGSWFGYVGIGLLYEIFAVAWIYRSTISDVTIITGAVLMVLGWVEYWVDRRVTGDMLSDNPWWAFVGIGTIAGLGGGAFSWFLEHPPPTAPTTTDPSQPVSQTVAAQSTVVTDAKAVVYILGLSVLFYAGFRILKAIGVFK